MGEAILINPFIQVYYATITVTYPSGSTLTASCGGETLTAESTSGCYTFHVPFAGTWVIKSVKGTQSASKNVSITSYNQSASVTLSYELVLLNGTSRSGWKMNTYSNAEWHTFTSDETTYGTLQATGGITKYGPKPDCYSTFYVTKDVTGYKTLKATITYTVGAAYNGRKWFGVFSDNSAIDPAATVKTVIPTSVTSSTTYSVSISSLSGSQIIGFAFASDDDPCYMNISKVWLVP